MKQTNKNIAFLVSSAAVSDIGDWISKIATMTLVLQIHATATSASMISLVSLIPTLIFSPIAGKFADKYNKKHILIISDILRSLLVLLIPFFPSQIFVLLFFTSSISAFANVSEDSIVPFLVDKDNLKRLNSIYSTFSSLVMVLGPSISGILLVIVDVRMCFVINSISFLASGLIRVGLRYQWDALNYYSKDQISKADVTTLQYIHGNPALFIVIFTIAAVGLASGMLNSLLIIYVYDYMMLSSASYGILLSFKGASMLITSALICKFGNKVPSEKLFCFSLLGLGSALILFPLNRLFIVGVLIQSINGICNAGYSIARTSLIQARTDPSKLGRVFSLNTMLSNLLSITSLGIFGGLADYIGVRTVLLLGGVIVFLAALYAVKNLVISHKSL